MATAQVSITEFAADKGLLGVPLWPKQAAILEEFWGQPGNYSLAVWALGRRSGKTLMAAVTAVYAGTMLADEYKRCLRPGERFYIVSIANTIDQAKLALSSIKDLINGSPILKPLIVRETTDTLELSNGAVFKALPASSRGGRGMACPLLIFDEIGHALDTEGGNAAGASIFQALSPSTAQFGSLGKVFLLSSPWVQQGIFWDLFKQANSGQFRHMQAVQAPTWEVNPTISKEWLEQERLRDPELFNVEYGANFSQSLSAFLDPALVDEAVNRDRGPLPPLAKFRGKYFLSLDPAKGGRDAYTGCICHLDGQRLVVDKFHQFGTTWGEGKKQQVAIAEVEDWILQQHHLYGFHETVLDQYNSQASIQRLTGKLRIRELTWTLPSKTQAFSKLRELVNGGNLELYNHGKAIQQLKNLVVTYRPGGTWHVSGGTGAAVDDYCSALAGAVLAARQPRQLVPPPQAFSIWHGPRARYP